MAIAQAVTCDVCGKVKGDVNHWWMVAEDQDEFALEPWKSESAHLYSHMCGQECAGKFLSKWMQAILDETATAKATA